MPSKKSGQKQIRIPVGVSPGQQALLKSLVDGGLYGTTEGDVIRYFMIKGIENLAETGVVRLGRKLTK